MMELSQLPVVDFLHLQGTGPLRGLFQNKLAVQLLTCSLKQIQKPVCIMTFNSTSRKMLNRITRKCVLTELTELSSLST